MKELKSKPNEVDFLVRVVNAFTSSSIAVVFYYLFSVFIFTEEAVVVYEATCWVFCLGLMETLTDPLLFKGALFIFVAGGVFGFLYWRENILKKLYEKYLKKP